MLGVHSVPVAALPVSASAPQSSAMHFTERSEKGSHAE